MYIVYSCDWLWERLIRHSQLGRMGSFTRKMAATCSSLETEPGSNSESLARMSGFQSGSSMVELSDGTRCAIKTEQLKLAKAARVWHSTGIILRIHTQSGLCVWFQLNSTGSGRNKSPRYLPRFRVAPR